MQAQFLRVSVFWLLKHKCVSVWGICGSVVLFHVCRESLCLQSDRIVLGQQKGAAAFCVKCNSAEHRCRSGNEGEIYREKLIAVTGSFVCWKVWLSLSFLLSLTHIKHRIQSRWWAQLIVSVAMSFLPVSAPSTDGAAVGRAGLDNLILVLKISPFTLEEYVWEVAFGGVYWLLELLWFYICNIA